MTQVVYSIKSVIKAAACVRIAMLIYGFIHDSMSQVKYTDIDYTVFTSSASAICQVMSNFYYKLLYNENSLLGWFPI